MARDRGRCPHHGRTDARHRRGGQGRDLRAHESPHRGRGGDPDDLLRAPRSSGHERPHPGDARRESGVRIRRRGRHPGNLAGRGPGAGVMTAWLRGLTHSRRAGTLVGLFLLCALLSALTPFFLTRSNLLNVMEQTAINAVIAVGMTFVILSAGIDLSVGSITALSGVVLANRLQAGWGLVPAIGAGLATGAACGLLSGLLITR